MIKKKKKKAKKKKYDPCWLVKHYLSASLSVLPLRPGTFCVYRDWFAVNWGYKETKKMKERVYRGKKQHRSKEREEWVSEERWHLRCRAWGECDFNAVFSWFFIILRVSVEELRIFSHLCVSCWKIQRARHHTYTRTHDLKKRRGTCVRCCTCAARRTPSLTLRRVGCEKRDETLVSAADEESERFGSAFNGRD